jgi:hypothetical protein
MPNTANTEVVEAAPEPSMPKQIWIHETSIRRNYGYIYDSPFDAEPDDTEYIRADIHATALAAAEAKGDKAGFERAREAAAGVVCPWCGDDQYDLVWHHEEWRHYRKSDQHVEYCKAAAIRSLAKKEKR